LEGTDQNPFILDSKEPDWTKFQEFLMNEVRYASLAKTFPEEAKQLFKVTQENALWRYNQYKRLTEFSK
jgi:pyruvate-ferredoxin/flavodoxin oxidoreductase